MSSTRDRYGLKPLLHLLKAAGARGRPRPGLPARGTADFSAARAADSADCLPALGIAPDLKIPSPDTLDDRTRLPGK